MVVKSLQSKLKDTKKDQVCAFYNLKPTVKCKVPVECAFYSKMGFSHYQTKALRRFNKAHQVTINQPFHLIQKHTASLKSVQMEYGLIDMFLNAEAVESNQKMPVRFMALANLWKGFTDMLVESDKAGVYLRNPWQRSDTRTLMFSLDKGQGTTKGVYIDTHKQDFNCGQNCNMIINVDNAPDLPQNCAAVFQLRPAGSDQCVGDFLSDLHRSCLFRVRLKQRGEYGGALAKTRSRMMLPILFMEWGQFLKYCCLCHRACKATVVFLHRPPKHCLPDICSSAC